MNRFKRISVATTLTAMAAGILMVCQPWARVLFQWGFAVIIGGIVGFVIASHLRESHLREGHRR